MYKIYTMYKNRSRRLGGSRHHHIRHLVFVLFVLTFVRLSSRFFFSPTRPSVNCNQHEKRRSRASTRAIQENQISQNIHFIPRFEWKVESRAKDRLWRLVSRQVADRNVDQFKKNRAKTNNFRRDSKLIRTILVSRSESIERALQFLPWASIFLSIVITVRRLHFRTKDQRCSFLFDQVLTPSTFTVRTAKGVEITTQRSTRWIFAGEYVQPKSDRTVYASTKITTSSRVCPLSTIYRY